MKKIASLVVIFILISLMEVEASPRYISLAPSTTEILFALGLNNEIVGISSYCDFPQETRSKTTVGDFSHPNIEEIIALNPDYIFCTGLEQAPVVQELKRLKLNVYVSDPANMEELFISITKIAQITGKKTQAQQLIQKMQNDMAAIDNKLKTIPPEKRMRIFVEIWHEPLMTAGSGSFVDELISLAGGINIAHELPRPYSFFSSEKVVNSNPQCIILAYMDKASPLKLVKSRFGWENIDAVRNHRVFNDITPDILLRPGPRITQGLKALYERMYER